MAVWKKAVASVIVMGLIFVGGYFLFSQAASRGGRVGENGGSFGGIDLRTVVPLTVIGGSAFITGFGFRDVIARAVAARQRSRLKSAQAAHR